MNGEACMAIMSALHHAGEWRVAEAALLCMLPTAPFNDLEDVLMWCGGQEEPEGEPLARALMNMSHRTVEPCVVASDSEGAAPGALPSPCTHAIALHCTVLDCTVLCCAVP